MPSSDYKLAILSSQLLCLSEFLDLQPGRRAEFDSTLYVEHRLAVTLADVYVDRTMVVAVEEEPKTVLREDPRHGRILGGDGL